MRFALILFSFFVVSCSQGNAEIENVNAMTFQPDLNKIPVEGCPAILNHNIRVLDSKEIINLCEHKDKVVLAVNVASRCGFTYQYEALQTLFESYQGKDLNNLGDVQTLDNITFNAGAGPYNLQKGGVQVTDADTDSVMIAIDGVVQGGNYTVNSTAGTITFDLSV